MTAHKKMIALLLTGLSVATITACGGSSGTREAKSDAPMPPISEMDEAMAAPAPAPLPLSDSDTLTPMMPVAAAPATSETSAAMMPAGGGNVEDRIARLEQSVMALRGDYDRMLPAFSSLNTTNERIQMLLDEIEKETGTKQASVKFAPPASTSVAATGTIPRAGQVSTAAPSKAVIPDEPPVVAAQATAFKAPPTADEAKAEAARQAALSASASAPAAGTAMAAPVAGGASTVKSLRIGEHGSKTRLVFDLESKEKPSFDYTIDATGKILTIDMPASAWSGLQSGNPNSPLVESWSVNKADAGGSSLAIQLKKGARVLSTEYLKADGKSGARLVMDIAAN